MVGALSLFPESAGAASAVIGALQYGFGVLGSVLVAILADGGGDGYVRLGESVLFSATHLCTQNSIR